MPVCHAAMGTFAVDTASVIHAPPASLETQPTHKMRAAVVQAYVLQVVLGT